MLNLRLIILLIVVSVMGGFQFVFPKTVLPKQILIIDSQNTGHLISIRESFIKELSRLGYTEGKNLDITYYSLGNFEGKAQSIWVSESQKNYDAIFLNGTIAANAFSSLSKSEKHKFVFATVTDPIGFGLIEDYTSHPKKNITGICFQVEARKRLEFVRKLLPKAKKIGLIYSDMPQSIHYRAWVEKVLRDPKFKDFEVLFRSVEFIKSEGGHKRMAILAQQYVKELNSQVDAFISPQDQMGANAPFSRMVYETATKPLIGVLCQDVMEGWGATASICSDVESIGKKAAKMVVQLFEGKSIKDIVPICPPKSAIAIDLKKAKEMNIKIPTEMLKAAGSNIVR